VKRTTRKYCGCPTSSSPSSVMIGSGAPPVDPPLALLPPLDELVEPPLELPPLFVTAPSPSKIPPPTEALQPARRGTQSRGTPSNGALRKQEAAQEGSRRVRGGITLGNCM